MIGYVHMISDTDVTTVRSPYVKSKKPYSIGVKYIFRSAPL